MEPLSLIAIVLTSGLGLRIGALFGGAVHALAGAIVGAVVAFLLVT